MSTLLPAPVADARFRRLEDVFRQRLAGIDLTKLLVYHLDHVDPSALPALAWQFKAFGPTWRLATTQEQQVALLKRVLARRRRKGTPWAVKDALDALGYTELHLEEGVGILHDGTALHDGVFRHEAHWALNWLVLPYALIEADDDDGAARSAAIAAAFDEWKRAAVRLAAIYYVTDPPSAEFHEAVAAVWFPDVGMYEP